MKKKIKHIEECRKAFEIEIQPAEVTKRLNECYDKIRKVAAVPGFRVGKAPRDLLERHYGERARREVVEELIADSYHTALGEEGFEPLGQPQLSDIKLDDSNVLFFKVEFNIRPTIALKGYKGLTLTKKKIGVKDEDVEKSLKALQELNTKYKNVEGRAVRMGDCIVCDSEIFIDGKLLGKKRENAWMPVDEKSYLPGLSERLVGGAAGEERDVETTLPDDFSNKAYAGKKALYKIRIKEIKEKTLPNIDDEFSKDLGYNDVADLRGAVQKILEDQIEGQLKGDLENQAIGHVLKAAGFSVPASLVSKQLEYLVDEEKGALLKRGLKEEDVKARQDELTGRLRPVAEKQVRTIFILDEIAEKEKIGVSQDEIDEALEAVARRYNQSKAKIEKYYKENDLIANVRAEIRHRKVAEFLVKEATIIVEEGGTK